MKKFARKRGHRLFMADCALGIFTRMRCHYAAPHRPVMTDQSAKMSRTIWPWRCLIGGAIRKTARFADDQVIYRFGIAIAIAVLPGQVACVLLRVAVRRGKPSGYLWQSLIGDSTCLKPCGNRKAGRQPLLEYRWPVKAC